MDVLALLYETWIHRKSHGDNQRTISSCFIRRKMSFCRLIFVFAVDAQKMIVRIRSVRSRRSVLGLSAGHESWRVSSACVISCAERETGRPIETRRDEIQWFGRRRTSQKKHHLTDVTHN